VIVTRGEDQAEPLARSLRALGHTVEVCPLVRIEPLADDGIDVTGYDWIVLTSPNGAAELTRRARALARHPRVAAIGPGTAAALRERGVEPALVATVSTQEGLLDELPQPAGRVLVAAAEGARRMLADSLAADFVPLYRTVPLRPERFPDGDLVLLASTSAARAFAAVDVDLPAVTIGPQTTAAARELGIRVVAEATTHDVAGLVAAVARAAAG
jgi:uroporphyrinogen-III synthase